MNIQNQIKRTLSQPAAIEFVSRMLKEREFLHRSELADFICEQYGFRDLGGQAQRSGCLKALRELEADGWFRLPEALHKTGSVRSPKGQLAAVSQAQGVPAEAGEIGRLRLLLVSDEESLRIWNEMMIREHPRGAGPLVGRQLRYLVDSEHGYLGGLGFAAPALQLADRDRWIGWNVTQRREHLHSVVCMSRFLIRPEIRCHNLASHILAMAMQQIAEDFQGRYHYRPWLVESFVDTSLYKGSCYKAANWVRVGQSKGRGRQDRYRKAEETIKDIYMYPLEKDFRRRLGLAGDAGGGPLGPSDGLEGEGWAKRELGGAPLGDARLSARLVEVAEAKAEQPGSAYTGVAEGDWPAVKAYYRLIDHPDEAAVNMVNILAPHRQRTMRRMQGQRTVLCIQDGSDLDYNSLSKCEGLGVIGTNQTGTLSRGLHLHTTLAVAGNGLPLGVLRAECIARQWKSPEDKRPASAIPMEERGTYCWIEGLRDTMSLAAEMPHTRLINVCDREADFFEMFHQQRINPCVDLLVRAKHDRKLSEESCKLFESVRQAPVQARIGILVPRQSARPKLSKQKARRKRLARTANFSVRYRQIQLCPPPDHRDHEPLAIWVLHALEESPPPGEEAIEWFLLTTIDITSAEQAVTCLRWYCFRWRIEDWHRVLKSGCRVEDLAHHTADRQRRAIAINLVIAWRIMLMTLLGRETPDLPADVLFSDIEIQVLSAYAKKKDLKEPLLLGEAVRLVASIAGYLGRAKDPPPGHQLMWKGFLELHFMCVGFALKDN
jgi:hypothetical protein